MDSVVSSDNNRFYRRNLLRRYALPVALTCVLGLILHRFNSYLFKAGFISNISLYLGEKSLLVHKGDPPRLENIGFDNPPLPHAIVSLGNDPLLMTAITGAICVNFLLIREYWHYRRGVIPFSLFAVLFLYVTLSPLSLFLLTQQLPLLLLLMLLVPMYEHLYRYARTGLSYHLFMFGIFSCIVLFTEFQAVLLLPLFTFGLVSRVIGRQPQRGLAILFAALFPVFFVSVSWMYLNWLFLGDPFHFLHYWRSALEPEVNLPGNALGFWGLWRAVLHAGSMLGAYWALLLPWFVLGVWLLFTFRRSADSVTLTVFAAPLLLLVIQLFCNFEPLGSVFFLVFVVTAVAIRVHQHRLINSTWFSPLFTLSLVVSLLAGFWLPGRHAGSEEQIFMELINGRQPEGNLAIFRQILADAGKDGKILLDDTKLYPLVFLSQEPTRFILPHNYEFETALSSPRQYVRYIVASEQRGMDAVGNRYALPATGYIPHFTLLARYGEYALYENQLVLPRFTP